MKPANKKEVERTFGLLEVQARQGMFKNSVFFALPFITMNSHVTPIPCSGNAAPFLFGGHQDRPARTIWQ